MLRRPDTARLAVGGGGVSGGIGIGGIVVLAGVRPPDVDAGRVAPRPARIRAVRADDAAVLAPSPAAKEESAEAVTQPRAEGFGVGDASELRLLAQLLLPMHAAMQTSFNMSYEICNLDFKILGGMLDSVDTL